MRTPGATDVAEKARATGEVGAGEVRLDAERGTGWYAWVARGGLVAKGVSYAIVGVLAIKLALGDGGETADPDGNGTSDPIETTLEWGVRSLGKRVSVNAEGDLPAEAVADLFPAYDDDGGLLLVLTPQ